ADVGRELAGDLVAQAQPGFDRAQSGADAACEVGLAVRFGFGAPLQDHALAEQGVVLHFQPCGGAAAFAEVDGGRDLDLEGRQSLNSDRQPVGVRVFAEIVTNDDKHILPGAHALPVQYFDVAGYDLDERRVAFAAQPQLAHVAAEPGAALPTEMTAAVAVG